MSETTPSPLPLPGLTNEAVTTSRAEHGRNVLIVGKSSGLLPMLKEVVQVPMFLLMLVACGVYVGLGYTEEALTLLAALLVILVISVYQSVHWPRS